jgi:hypothetical protein
MKKGDAHVPSRLTAVGLRLGEDAAVLCSEVPPLLLWRRQWDAGDLGKLLRHQQSSQVDRGVVLARD